MSFYTKKKPHFHRKSVARVMSNGVRFAKPDPDMDFAFFHSMDVWQKAEIEIRRQIKKIKDSEEQKDEVQKN